MNAGRMNAGRMNAGRMNAFRSALWVLLPAALLLPGRAEAASRKTSLGLATVSAGTWTAYGDLDGFAPGSYSS
jgi:hypothetical protein